MTKPFVGLSTRKRWCFDTVCRLPGSMSRHKQASLQQQSIVHLSKPLTQSEMREVRLWWMMASVVSRGSCWSGWGGGGVGGYWSHCGHLWYLLRALSIMREGKWGQSGVVFGAHVWWSRQTTTARQTGSLKVQPVTLPGLRKQTCFWFSLS